MVISSNNSVKARKKHVCSLCGEHILPGEVYCTRTGVEEGDGFWTMRMHAECEAYESPQTVDPEWYEDISEPAFYRADALAARATTKGAE